MTTTEVQPSSAPPGEQTRRIQLSEVSWPELASTIGLVVMAIIFAVINPGYLSEGNVSAILQASAILIVLTIGQTFVIATGGIDLSVASNMTLGAIVLGEFYAAGTGIAVAALAGAGRVVAGGTDQRPADLQGRDHRLHRHPGHPVGGLRVWR